MDKYDIQFQLRLLEDARDTILRKIERDADLHYSNIIFSPDYPGQTPEEKWMGSHGRDDTDLIGRLNAAILHLENQQEG